MLAKTGTHARASAVWPGATAGERPQGMGAAPRKGGGAATHHEPCYRAAAGMAIIVILTRPSV